MQPTTLENSILKNTPLDMDKWREIIKSWNPSTESQKDYCLRLGISLSTFCYVNGKFMKKYFLIFWLVTPLKLLAINPETLKKYPYQLLTNDYGILNAANLKRYTKEINVEPFTGKFNGLDYWQCFSTKNITVWYEKENDD